MRAKTVQVHLRGWVENYPQTRHRSSRGVRYRPLSPSVLTLYRFGHAMEIPVSCNFSVRCCKQIVVAPLGVRTERTTTCGDPIFVAGTCIEHRNPSTSLSTIWEQCLECPWADWKVKKNGRPQKTGSLLVVPFWCGLLTKRPWAICNKSKTNGRIMIKLS